MRKDTLIHALMILVLLFSILWATKDRWNFFRSSTPAPSPTPTLEVKGAWREAPEVIGAMFLAVCNDYTRPFIALRPTPPGIVRAIADAWPDKPRGENYVALSRAIYIPRYSNSVAKDVDTWLQQHGTPSDCANNPWEPEAVERIKEASDIALFGVARPVVLNDTDLWEIAFGVTRWAETRR